jgi:isoaspartyl peptidase/L-asparaginase-like protein (Ntn-hydrolase superfamily)
MEFDAAIMDHRRRYGAVMALQNIQKPVSVAKSILRTYVHLFFFFNSFSFFLLFFLFSIRLKSNLMKFFLFYKFFLLFLEDCVHNVLCGDGALKWAVSQGFEECNGNGVDGKKVVLTEKSKKEWETWMEEKKIDGSVEKKVEKKVEEGVKEVEKEVVDDDSHDTVGLICLDDKGRLACGTSTSG